MLALRRLPAATRRLPVLVQPRRTFVGGAFETDFEESRAKVAPAAPADEDEPPEPDVLTDEQRKTLIGLRASVALQGLPGLWEQLSRAPADVPLPAVLEAAQALTSLEPWERLRLHLKLSRSDGPVDLSAQLKSAAVSTAEGSYPLTAVLLERFEMLSEEESSRIVELKDKAAPTLVEEIRKKPMLTRLWHRLAGGRTVDGTDREVAAADRTDIALYASLESERTLQEALTKALFSYHDRLSTRRRRRRNAVKYTLLFFSLNILDFVITNM